MTVPSPHAVFDDSPAARKREQRGWYFYDWANSAFPTTVLTVFLGPYLTEIATAAACAKDFATNATCGADTFDALVAANPGLGYIDVLGMEMRPGAFYPFVVGTAAIIQVVLMLVAGALADHTGRKKQIMGFFAYLGAAATLAMWFIADGRYLLGGLLYIVASVSFACAFVVYNSFLPEISTPDERDKVSAQGWGFGYLGGFLLLAINLGIFLGHEALGVSAGDAVRIALASAGVWWGGFTIIPLLRLRNRRPLARGAETTGQAVAGSFRQLGRTIRELRLYPLTLGFLIAYLIYNDGVQTVISFSATYASKELGLGQTIQISAILMVQLVAFFGALLLGRLARSYGAKQVVLFALVAWTIVVAVAYFLPRGSAVAFFAMGFAIAIVMGGTQALSRSLFSYVIPKGKEAEYYSLYEISDKGSTLLGSWTIALAVNLTNSYRIAILSLVVFFIIGGLMLWRLDLPKAIRAAGNEVPAKI
ncbi:MFS transporter [Nonomuraea soli]|uniref:UMF1 family MFS transporter n=1 Tax=Nonomuraea soli TaxID=1032476 RepID=A0A7W0HUN4_9ACTN|nr:MFS transporter [Nonomuraea soli]MBA2896364.1 UMF1 family MFS transporter [Nonomuraea soli]